MQVSKADKGVQSELLWWGTLTNWIGNRNFQPITLQGGIQVFVRAYKGALGIAKSRWNKVTGVQVATREEGSRVMVRIRNLKFWIYFLVFYFL